MKQTLQAISATVNCELASSAYFAETYRLIAASQSNATTIWLHVWRGPELVQQALNEQRESLVLKGLIRLS